MPRRTLFSGNTVFHADDIIAKVNSLLGRVPPIKTLRGALNRGGWRARRGDKSPRGRGCQQARQSLSQQREARFTCSGQPLRPLASRQVGGGDGRDAPIFDHRTGTRADIRAVNRRSRIVPRAEMQGNQNSLWSPGTCRFIRVKLVPVSEFCRQVADKSMIQIRSGSESRPRQGTKERRLLFQVKGRWQILVGDRGVPLSCS